MFVDYVFVRLNLYDGPLRINRSDISNVVSQLEYHWSVLTRVYIA